MLSGSWDQTVIIWDMVNGKKLAKLTGHQEVVNCVRMSHRQVVSGSSDARLRIWDLFILEKKLADSSTHHVDKANVKKIVEVVNVKVLEGHTSDVYCLEVHGDFIVSGGADSLVIVWSLPTGDLLHRLAGHLGIVRCLFIDEYKCVSGGDAKKIIVWDYKQGKMFNILHRNPTKLNTMWLSDTSIVTTSPDSNSTITIINYW